MSILDLFRPKWRNSDWMIRRHAVSEEVKDQTILEEIARQDSHPEVRGEAIGRIRDRSLRAELFRAEPDPEARVTALWRFIDQSLQAETALNDPSAKVRYRALGGLEDLAVLKNVASDDPEKEVRVEATFLAENINNGGLYGHLSDSEGHRFEGESDDPIGIYQNLFHHCPHCEGVASPSRSLWFFIDATFNKGFARFECAACSRTLRFPPRAFVPGSLENLWGLGWSKPGVHGSWKEETLGKMKKGELLVDDWMVSFITLNKKGGSPPPWEPPKRSSAV
jgi:hypothetical protein